MNGWIDVKIECGKRRWADDKSSVIVNASVVGSCFAHAVEVVASDGHQHHRVDIQSWTQNFLEL
jgi:hypothetical protein